VPVDAGQTANVSLDADEYVSECYQSPSSTFFPATRARTDHPGHPERLAGPQLVAANADADKGTDRDLGEPHDEGAPERDGPPDARNRRTDAEVEAASTVGQRCRLGATQGVE
jgi:hypothetical protein